MLQKVLPNAVFSFLVTILIGSVLFLCFLLYNSVATAQEVTTKAEVTVESMLRDILARLDRIEKRLGPDGNKLVEAKAQWRKWPNKVLEDPKPDGKITEWRDDVGFVETHVPEPLLEAYLEGRLPDWAQTVYDATKKMDDPERTYRQRQLMSMLKIPLGKRTRQQVLDGIPKGDPLYNFTSEEWQAMNATDEEWKEEFGTDPSQRPERK